MGQKLPNNAVLVTTDVVGLYTNVPQAERIKATAEALNERQTVGVPTPFLTRLLELVLQENIFENDSKLYRQQIGTSMGSKPAPDYANIFMARVMDPQINVIAQKYTEGNIPLNILKCSLDDIFAIFVGTTQNLHKFIEDIDKIHPAIKFTMSHTSIQDEDLRTRSSCPEQQPIPFLDTSISIKEGKKIYRPLQETNRPKPLLIDKFLPPKPNHTKYSILPSLENTENMFRGRTKKLKVTGTKRFFD